MIPRYTNQKRGPGEIDDLYALIEACGGAMYVYDEIGRGWNIVLYEKVL